MIGLAYLLGVFITIAALTAQKILQVSAWSDDDIGIATIAAMCWPVTWFIYTAVWCGRSIAARLKSSRIRPKLRVVK